MARNVCNDSFLSRLNKPSLHYHHHSRLLSLSSHKYESVAKRFTRCYQDHVVGNTEMILAEVKSVEQTINIQTIVAPGMSPLDLRLLHPDRESCSNCKSFHLSFFFPLYNKLWLMETRWVTLWTLWIWIWVMCWTLAVRLHLPTPFFPAALETLQEKKYFISLSIENLERSVRSL